MGLVPKGLFLDQNWRALSACSGSDPDLWFAPGAREHDEAKAICRSCPVRPQCLTYAMEARRAALPLWF